MTFPSRKVPNWLRSFWQFSRPHTIIGTTLSVWSIYTLAVMDSGQAWDFLPMAIGAWVACLAGNVYIVGLNQILDIPIDQINKPHLPLAAGEFTVPQAWIIVISMGLVSLGLGIEQGMILLGVISLSLLIGTAYSLPPIRLKRYPFWAALCILGVRGIIVNLGLFWHFQARLNQPLAITNLVWALTGFVVVFTVAIALCKDIPDLEGDRQFQIATLTVRFGPKAVFQITLAVLALAYGGLILTSLVVNLGVNLPLFVGGHLLLLVILWLQARRVELNDITSITRFYQFIWRLFFWEYIFLPVLAVTNHWR
ncbi:homogentisate phytyltransferase [Thermosynechococcaceae cyanobacterium BACA0444]|uniref:Homogentisate phytyltransferase n=1 Tax=Pseudocalidococcus azoricus BACA0444 TaxID=2918990 RepID=A0AAE4FTK1_9CYAN|nr:homogentisate phytyltransferase [Pseudocalidococcus azoricus]MDS3861995.1 homogentisate phytyltransferase [Pseudocalidococcus azoricus BACA0444]